jgi:CBS domain-containing protein
MSQPLMTIDAEAPGFAALRLMIDRNIHHLPVVEEGKIVGVISATDLLLQETHNPLYLRSVIDRLDEPAAIGGYAGAIAALAQTLFESGVDALHISQIVSRLNDALVKRIIQLSEKALGAPPAPYAWIVFGSEGRMEQTLLTDQDNALVYADAAGEASPYFVELAQRVVDGLIQAGFPPCPGGFMATNWCKPLGDWTRLFTNWIRLPEPAALLDAAIFFDFRPVAGTLALEALEQLIVDARNEKLFLAHMANGALAFRPPLGFFNRLRSENGKVEIKRAGIAPVVSIARVAALAAGSRERSSVERLRVAAASGQVIDSDSAHSLAEILPMFLRLRLRAQLAAQAKQETPDNNVALADLSSLDRRHLKEAFVLVKEVQETLRSTWRLDSLA